MVGKILVADDEKGIRMMLADMLTIDGYQVVQAANGQEAITLFETLQPDLVILDGMMPVLSGFEACKQIKEKRGGSRTPVLMLTALEDSGAVEQAFDAGATDYITKPLRWPLLRQRVKRLVESHQTEEALHHTRQILQNVLSSVPMFFHAVDQQGIFTLTKGCIPVIPEVESRVGMSFFDLYRDHPSLIKDMQRALAGESFQTDYENNGHKIQVWYAPLFDSSGGKTGAVVGGANDHERKEFENTLARERNLMRILIDNLPDYVFVKDTEGRFIVTNIANTRYLGRQRPQEVIGRTDFDFFPPERAEMYWQRDQEIMQKHKEGMSWEQVEDNHQTGQKRWYAITKVPFLDAQNQVLGIVGMIRDITRDKEARDEMRLANEQLIELNRLKSHFVLTMSHELRTPLNSILGYSELLLQETLGTLNEKQRDRLERVVKNGEQLLALIDDVLDISKIQTGQMQLKLQPTPLEALIQECFSGYASTAQKKGLDFQVEVQPNLSPVIGDSTAILKILTNLVNNAIKFTPRGIVKVSARQLEKSSSAPKEIDPNKTWILIAVEDTGIGISPENQRTLFNEFSQIDNAPTREQGGTGLGLALSYQLVSLMHGRMWLESAPGLGSQFYVLLPAAD